VEEIVFKTLEEAAENGFPQERIEAVLHHLELSLRHVCNVFFACNRSF
jgi:Zn-dependent M16 (insulinase) family peptidase